MKKLDRIYLDIDEENMQDGIDAISLVKFPAIEENFVALNEHKVELKTIDEEKRIVIGLALIPEKDIYRRNGDYEYYIRFSKDTVRKASELYLKKLKIHNSTLEHEKKTDGVYTIESWIVEDINKDKSALYNLNAVEGSWVVVQRIDNDEVWNDVKQGKYQGYSIEGYFSEKAELQLQQDKEQELIEKIKEIILNNEKKKIDLESYSDYPDAVSNNAKRGIELNEKNGNKCATQVGKVRAQQLANKEPISKETIQRMFSYLSRAKEYYNENDSAACGTISYLLWGGDAALNWSERKLEQINKKNEN